MNQKQKEVPKKQEKEDNFVAFVSKDELNKIDASAQKNTPTGFAMPPPPGS